MDKVYEYNGPVYKFDKYVDSVYIRTSASSISKAISNIRYRLARQFNSKYIIYNIIENKVMLVL